MSHYRDLNKELVEQVQTMRVNIKLYCDEIINLKAELMQKYESELLLRKYCYNWALDNFQQLIQTVQPDSDILPLLKQHLRPDRETVNRRSSSPFRSRTHERIRSSGSEKSSGERRRSSILAMECQRSNSIINNRKSVRSCSPIRPSSGDGYDDEEDEETEGPEQDDGMLEKNRESDQQSNLNQKGNSNAVEVFESGPESNVERNKDNNFVIYEESEEEEEEEDEQEDVEIDDVYDEVENVLRDDVVEQKEELQPNEEDNIEESEENDDQDVESVYESVEEVTVNSITRTRATLTDITNTSVNLSNSYNTNKNPTHKRRGRPKKCLPQQENHSDTDTDMDISAVVNRRQIPKTKRKTDDAVKDIENTTVQEPRRYSNATNMAQGTNKSIPTTHNLSQTCDEITINSLVSVDMTMRNFQNAASSTPNSRRQSLRRPLTPPSRNSPYHSPDSRNFNSTTNDNSKRRPTRQCKPKVLTEPHLNTKLRNENEIKKKAKAKTSKSNKKK